MSRHSILEYLQHIPLERSVVLAVVQKCGVLNRVYNLGDYFIQTKGFLSLVISVIQMQISAVQHSLDCHR